MPDEMHREIRELVKGGKYRSVADFFYIAGQKELDRVKAEERLQRWKEMQKSLIEYAPPNQIKLDTVIR